METLEKGNWPAIDVANIVESVKSVFERRDIMALSKKTYKFITLHLGFVAHYDKHGFCHRYRDDLAAFARALLTSEYSNDPNYNKQHTDWYEKDDFFIEKCGMAYCKSRADVITQLLELAEKWLPILEDEQAQALESNEMSALKCLAEKYGYKLAK